MTAERISASASAVLCAVPLDTLATSSHYLDAESSHDSDSAFGDGDSTYTASITSSVTKYEERYGRRYHSHRSGAYALPNDDQEADRLDINHAMFRLCLGDRLYLAPISPTPHRVLDLGTGTGIWAIDFADDHPSAEVIGNDLSPTQPTLVPPNLQFLVDDIEDVWGYESLPFDFVHARFLAGSIRDWPRLMEQAFACTRPGGWVEFQDLDTFLYSTDDSVHADSALNKFHQMTGTARESVGYDMKPGRSLEKWIREAGFVNVVAQKFLLPLGPWPKDKMAKVIGAFNMVQMESAIEGICLGTLMNIPMPWTYDEIQVFVAQIRNDLYDRRIHGIHDFYVVYGQKPE